MTQASRDRTEYVEISGTAAERAAFNNPKQAMEWYETDTTARYKYLSGAWVILTATGGAAPGYGGSGGSSNVTVINSTGSPANVQIASLYYPLSTQNSTSAQLASGASFTGGIETVQSLQAAQIEIFGAKAFILDVNQYIDAAGTQLSGTRRFTRLSGTPMNINILLPGNYFNLVFTNTDVAATTQLVINTTFGIMDSVDDTGRMMVNTPQAKPITGQQLATTTAVALPALALLNGAVITASSKNTGAIAIGPLGLTAANDGSGTGEILDPGMARSFAAEILSQIFIRVATGNASTTDFVTFSGN